MCVKTDVLLALFILAIIKTYAINFTLSPIFFFFFFFLNSFIVSPLYAEFAGFTSIKRNR